MAELLEVNIKLTFKMIPETQRQKNYQNKQIMQRLKNYWENNVLEAKTNEK